MCIPISPKSFTESLHCWESTRFHIQPPLIFCYVKVYQVMCTIRNIASYHKIFLIPQRNTCHPKIKIQIQIFSPLITKDQYCIHKTLIKYKYADFNNSNLMKAQRKDVAKLIIRFFIITKRINLTCK
jgi:hypothetical protein